MPLIGYRISDSGVSVLQAAAAWQRIRDYLEKAVLVVAIVGSYRDKAVLFQWQLGGSPNTRAPMGLPVPLNVHSFRLTVEEFAMSGHAWRLRTKSSSSKTCQQQQSETSCHLQDAVPLSAMRVASAGVSKEGAANDSEVAVTKLNSL